ncbi:MAG: hypothetical protein JST61_11390 [Acidobacteria bacterium]|nr:hypothetical protein [Acidobacteriota bacterium]
MSAAHAILPVVWATAAPRRKPTPKASKPKKQRPVVPELAFYRKYTEALLRRYLKLSMESGRAPSLLGREMFRGNVTHYKVECFDDAVNFVLDVTRCLDLLDRTEAFLINRIAIQQYTQLEVALMIDLPIRSVMRRYDRSLDVLTRLFLDRRLLVPLKP